MKKIELAQFLTHPNPLVRSFINFCLLEHKEPILLERIDDRSLTFEIGLFREMLITTNSITVKDGAIRIFEFELFPKLNRSFFNVYNTLRIYFEPSITEQFILRFPKYIYSNFNLEVVEDLIM